MHSLQKTSLPVEESDRPIVRQLKQECNQLIEQYNQLEDPFAERGQELVTQINALVMKLHQLKDYHYENRR